MKWNHEGRGKHCPRRRRKRLVNVFDPRVPVTLRIEGSSTHDGVLMKSKSSLPDAPRALVVDAIARAV